MKKLGLVLGLGLLGATTLFADYQLTLIDKDGVETTQCIKSYSFSNNLESIARKNNLDSKDVYSEEETMTNKVYLGKPVYRTVTTIPTLSASYSWRFTNYTKIPENMETFLSAKYIGNFLPGASSHVNNQHKMHFELYSSGIGYTLGSSRVSSFSNKKVILEYTKTTDTVSSSSNSFKSYLHYVLSSSENEDVTTVDLKNTGVKFLENYTYDSSTDSCIEN